ncbi:recombinase family protein [Brevundimonas diminuta]|uniref:recombinase family protein n=1 Tax=Brevundimonas diminuta TaxID=293 RepID=UPI003D001DAF
MKAKEIKKALIYCRVSSAKQRIEGHGLESQETRCRQYAQARGYQVIETFKDEFTGASTKRPGMLALLKTLKAARGETYIVIIDDISRLARSVESHIELRSAITLAGGILESPSVEFGDDADSELQEFILATVAQHQRRKNAEQVKNRMTARALNGYWGFQAPVGYRYAKVSGHGKLLVKDEPYASYLKEALEGYASGRFQTQAEVMRFLMAQPEWANSTASKLHSQAISNILTRVIYAGYIDIPDWGVTMRQGQHEPIISFETFQKIQKRLTEGAKVPARLNIKDDFPLRGFIKCGDCGMAMQGIHAKGRSKHYNYYLCMHKGCSQYGKSSKQEVVEEQFADLLKAMQPSYALFAVARDTLCDLWRARLAASTTQRRSLELELSKLDRGIAQLVDRIVACESDSLVKTYEARIREMETRKVEIREKAANLGKPKKDFPVIFKTAMRFLANPYNIWASGEMIYRRMVLKLAFADRVTYLRGEGFKTVDTALPFKMLGQFQAGIKEMVDATGIEPVTPSV